LKRKHIFGIKEGANELKKTILLVISCVYILLSISCNANIDLQLHKKDMLGIETKKTQANKTQADITVNITMKHYLVQYLTISVIVKMLMPCDCPAAMPITRHALLLYSMQRFGFNI
jgi:hypothetical protein